MAGLIDKSFTYALIGASNNQEKFGHKVLKDLLDKGFCVVPINPHEEEILGKKE
jgi:predicted CoA-binding protein